jgi:hypothetical protein
MESNIRSGIPVACEALRGSDRENKLSLVTGFFYMGNGDNWQNIEVARQTKGVGTFTQF